MENTLTLDQNNENEIKQLFVGRRIVQADMGQFDIGSSWEKASGRLILDDGTVIYVVPHEGGCSCSAGDYELMKLATVDNAISDVSLVNDPAGDDYDDGEGVYRIHVVADAIDMDVVEIEGSDGNGYYGTGYELFVHLPSEVA